jgi:hypothetical protein
MSSKLEDGNVWDTIRGPPASPVGSLSFCPGPGRGYKPRERRYGQTVTPASAVQPPMQLIRFRELPLVLHFNLWARFERLLIPALLASVFLVRAVGELRSPRYSEDQCWQIQATYHLLAGRGVIRELVDPGNWSQTFPDPLIYWPPGYSFLLALPGLAGIDLIRGAQILNLAALLIFLAALHRLARSLDLDRRVYGAILVAMILPGHFLFRLTSTDFLSLTAFLWAVLQVLRGAEKGQSPCRAAIVGCLIFLAALFRYSYYPMLAVIPLALLLAGRLGRRRDLTLSGLISGTVAGLCLVLLSSIQVRASEQPWYIEPTADGKFHISNLLKFDNFVLTTFFDTGPDSLAAALQPAHPLADRLIVSVGILLAVALLAFLVRAALRLLRPKGELPSSSTTVLLLYIALLTLCLNVSSLVVLSLRHPSQLDWYGPWTYVAEARYFAPTMAMILCCTALAATQSVRARRYVSLPAALLALSLAAAACTLAAQAAGWYRRPVSPEFVDLRDAEIRLKDLVSSTHQRVVLFSRFGTAPALAISGCKVVHPDHFAELAALAEPPTSEDIQLVLWTSVHPDHTEQRFLLAQKAEPLATLKLSRLWRVAVHGPRL